MRTDFIGIKVTEQENNRIRRKAEIAKMNLSTYVRTSALEKEIKVIDGLREMIPELNAMGNNLNQLTVMLRIGHIHNPNLEVIKEQFTKFIEVAESALEGR
jgi:hypothetical protein